VSAALCYRAPTTLARFMRSNAFVRAVVGPVGSGKSSACCVEVLRRAIAQEPGEDKVRRTRFAVIRNTYRELKDTTRKTFEQWVPAKLGSWKEQDFTFTIDKPLTDVTRVHCEVLFRALDRPQDVQKLLSLELTGAYINEARQVPKAILDVLSSRVGRYPSKAQGGATWFGIWMDTNPWFTGHWGYKLFSKDRPEGFELFEQPGGRAASAENLENLPVGYYDRLCAGKDSAWVDEYVDSNYPTNDVGSFYGVLLAALEVRGALGVEAPRDVGGDGVFTFWDLGRADDTAIWWLRLREGSTSERPRVDVLSHYAGHGENLSHYFGVLEERARQSGWKYVRHVFPHDARAKTLASELSVIEQAARRLGAGMVEIGPELSLKDGIAAVRWLLQQEVRFFAACSALASPKDCDGVDALRSYRRLWDEERKCFREEPVHDWASHTADAFRYAALFIKRAEYLTRGLRLQPFAVPTQLTYGEVFEELE